MLEIAGGDRRRIYPTSRAARGTCSLLLLGLIACLGSIRSGLAGAPKAAEPAALPMPLYTSENAPHTPKVEELEQRSSVSKDGITWTFEKNAPVGRFVNGDWYVVGPATVTAIDPQPLWDAEVKNTDPEDLKRAKDKRVRNGSVLNPPLIPDQAGFDTRCRRYHDGLRVRPPLSLKPGDVLVSTISTEKIRDSTGGGSATESVSLLTCLAAPVPPDAWRTSYGDRKQTIYLARNLRRDRLLKLPVPQKPPDLKALARDFARPWLEINFYGICATSYQREQYGRAVCQAGAEATLSLLMDYPPEEKEGLLVGYVQYGLDLFGLVKNGHPGWIGDGGWGAGRKWPMVFAGLMLDQPEMAQVVKTCPQAVLAEDHQAFYDDCWTGARVCFAFDNPNGVRNKPFWGAYEHWPPSRWDSMHGQYYRCDSTSSTWVGQALAIHLLKAEETWGCNAWLDYCDRWMYEQDPGYGSFGKQGEAYRTWPWFAEMWNQYRMNPPSQAGQAVKPWPNTGWKREPPQDSASVPVEIGKNREFRVKGKAFFPIMLFAETPARIELAKSLGVNVIAEGNFLSAEMPQAVSNKSFLDELAKHNLYGVFGADMRAAGHPNLLGWIHVDAPDRILGKPWKEWDGLFYGFAKMLKAQDALEKPIPGQAIVTSAFSWMKKTGPTRPVFLTVGESFFKAWEEGKKELCKEYLKNCEVLCYRGSSEKLGGALEKLLQLGAGKPVIAWIETQGARAEDIRSAVCTAIAKGASGIGYRGFEGFEEVKLEEALRSEIRRLNEQITGHAEQLINDRSQAESWLK